MVHILLMQHEVNYDNAVCYYRYIHYDSPFSEELKTLSMKKFKSL